MQRGPCARPATKMEEIRTPPAAQQSKAEERLLACLAKLEQPWRRVIQLRHVDGLEWDALAKALGRSDVEEVRRLYHRARIELRARFDAE